NRRQTPRTIGPCRRTRAANASSSRQSMNRVNRPASVALAPVAAITTRTSGSSVLTVGCVVISLLRCLLLVLLFPDRGRFHPPFVQRVDHGSEWTGAIGRSYTSRGQE